MMVTDSPAMTKSIFSLDLFGSPMDGQNTRSTRTHTRRVGALTRESPYVATSVVKVCLS